MLQLRLHKPFRVQHPLQAISRTQRLLEIHIPPVDSHHNSHMPIREILMMLPSIRTLMLQKATLTSSLKTRMAITRRRKICLPSNIMNMRLKLITGFCRACHNTSFTMSRVSRRWWLNLNHNKILLGRNLVAFRDRQVHHNIRICNFVQVSLPLH